MVSRRIIQWRHILRHACYGLVLAWMGVGTAVAAVPAADAVWLFNADTLASQPELLFEVRVHLTQAVYDRLAAIGGPGDPAKDIYETVDLELVCGSYAQARCDGATSKLWPGVGFKLKGQFGSFRTMAEKAGFKVKFKKTNLFFGLKKLTLNNNVQDYSRMNQTLSYDLFRASNVAAPRTGYTLVKLIVAKTDATFETLDYGLYLNVETPDDVFLMDRFGNFQHLYEGNYGTDLYPGSEPVVPLAEYHYELAEGSATDFSDLTSLIQANGLSGSGPDVLDTRHIDAWFTAIQAKTDMAEMTRMWAVEAYIAHIDGYVQQNNYYLYSDTSGRFSMLPWGTDETFGEGLLQGFTLYPMISKGTLAYRCRFSTPCKAMFDSALDVVSANAASLDLATKAVNLFAVLQPYIAADPRKEDTVENSILARDKLIAFLAAQPGVIQDYRNCVPDTDGDGYSDCTDAFPLHRIAAVDTDKDGMPDSFDAYCVNNGCWMLSMFLDDDDDNDGIPDIYDAASLVPLGVNGVFKGSRISEAIHQ